MASVAILHNSSYGYGIGGASCYHNFYYVNIALKRAFALVLLATLFYG